MRRRIIIDTDPGIDDAVAILLALAAPEELEVLGIVAVAGNLPLAQTERNARRVCELAGRRDIPVYAGCVRPMLRPLATAEHVHGETDRDRLLLPEPTMAVQALHGVDFLLDHRHLWLRSPRVRAIFSVRNEIEQAIHDFFYDRGFLRVDTPILTAAIGERSGLFSTEYFEEGHAYLAQTGQLYGEAAAAAFGRIYTFGPTFRAEKSKTRRHLTEFWMIEPEVAWNDSADNMRLQEDFVSFLVQRCLERRAAELAEELLGSSRWRRWRSQLRGKKGR